MENRSQFHRAAIDMIGSPFYLYDEKLLTERIELVRRILPGIGLCYAMKAAPALAERFGKRADRLEVCSPGEYEICAAKAVSPEKILVSGVNKTMESMRWILAQSEGKGYYTIESARHFEILKGLSEENEQTLCCYIRLSSGNQFGVDEKELEKLCERVIAAPNLTLSGIHYFSGTQKSMNRIEKELSYLADYGKRIKERFGISLSLEYGPGLSVNCFLRQSEQGGTWETALSEEKKDAEGQLLQLQEAVKVSGIEEVYGDITFEYGRFLAACCGFYFTQVADLKMTEDVRYAILDGGIHHITYYGSMAGMKQPYIDVAKRAREPADEKADVQQYLLAGSLCTANDVLVRKASLPRLSIGDVLRFSLAGAYCSTEAVSLLLSRKLPALALLTTEGEIVLFRDHQKTSVINAPGIQTM